MSPVESQNGPHRRQGTLGFGFSFAGQDHPPSRGEGTEGAGLMAAPGGQSQQTPGMPILEKEETRSLKVNEKGHKVKMKFITGCFFNFFDFCFF